jgi:hypothetical protein
MCLRIGCFFGTKQNLFDWFQRFWRGFYFYKSTFSYAGPREEVFYSRKIYFSLRKITFVHQLKIKNKKIKNFF